MELLSWTGFMNGIFLLAFAIVILVFLLCLTPRFARHISKGWGGGCWWGWGRVSEKGLKPQPRDSDMRILGYFEDIKNTGNVQLWWASEFLTVTLQGKQGFTQPILGQKTADEPGYPQVPYNRILECTHFFPGSNLNSVYYL